MYQTVAPADERRTLTCLGGTDCPQGWKFDSLDGTVKTFNADGTWFKTVDPNGNMTMANYTSGQLDTVSFADERSESFTYHPDGKLASITENGIDDVPERTWTYTWDGDDLQRIDRPDGTAVRFEYSAVLGGHINRQYAVATDDSERIARAWQYDITTGHVVKTWSGSEDFDAANAQEKYEFEYSGTDPLKPTTVTVTGPLGGTTTYTVDQSLDKPRLDLRDGSCGSCGLGPFADLTYGDNDNPYSPTRIADGEGNITDFTYNTSGARTQRIRAPLEPEEQVTDWVYGDIDFPTKPTQERQTSVDGTPMGRTTTLDYDAAGNLEFLTVAGVEGGNAFSYTTETAYNSEGRPTTIDPGGFGTSDQTTFVYYPARGNLLVEKRIDPLVGETKFNYDDLNRRTSTVDPNLVETVTAYDSMDRITSVTQKGATAPDDLVTNYEYNVFGDLFRITRPEGNVVEYGYDHIGRLNSIEFKPNNTTPGERTFYMHDAAGNRISEELQEWDGSSWQTVSQTSSNYGSECRLLTTTRGGALTRFGYDCNGNLAQVWDANHDPDTEPPTTVYTYDALNRLATVTKPWGGSGGGDVVTTYGYDVQSHLTSVTDGENNTTTYEYSDRDLLTEEVSPVSGTTTHTYNEHGQLLTSLDERGETVTRTVDAADRVEFVDFTDDTLDVDFDYGVTPAQFDVGRLISITRDSESIQYTYDRWGRMLQDGELIYGYDKNGNRTSITYPGGVTATYTPDFADRQNSLTVDDGVNPPLLIASGVTYEPSGPLKTVELANGVTETRFFDPRYSLDVLEVSGLAGPEPIIDFEYDTDEVGNVVPVAAGRCDDLTLTAPYTSAAVEQECGIIRVTGTVFVDTTSPDEVRFEAGQKVAFEEGFSVTLGSTFRVNVMPGLLAQETYQFGYQDFQYFLTQGDGPWGDLSWTYDKIGNRITETRDGKTDTYLYATNGSGNTPVLESIDLAPPMGTRTFTHGVAGHLEEVDSAGNVIDFAIDEAGRMSSIDRASASESVDVSYDGRSFLSGVERPISGPDLATTEPVYSSDGLLQCLDRREGSAAPTETTYYFYLAGRPVAQLLKDGSTSTWTYLTTDQLGTPLIATDSAGDTVWQGPLEPFGQDWQEGSGGAIENGLFLRFPGQWTMADGRTLRQRPVPTTTYTAGISMGRGGMEGLIPSASSTAILIRLHTRSQTRSH